MRDGYLRVAAAVPHVTIADPEANARAITALALELDARGVELAVMPEMCITGYTCADLFHNRALLDAASRALDSIHQALQAAGAGLCLIVGLPMECGPGGALCNCAVALEGARRAVVTKTYVPNYNEFYERRWWAPGSSLATIATHGTVIGVEVCEDLWAPIPPSTLLAMKGATVIFNLSASDDLIGKYDYLRKLVEQQSARCLAAYVYAGAGRGESSTDLVFDGKGLIAENGTMLAEKPRWDDSVQCVVADIDIEALRRDRLHYTTWADCASRWAATEVTRIDLATPAVPQPDDPGAPLLRNVDPTPFVPADTARRERRSSEILHIQSAALQQRLRAIGCRTLTVGVSGGLDSTLALLVAVDAFDALGLPRAGIIGVTMPGFGTTGRTRTNATELMAHLGVTIREVPIGPAVEQHFSDIGHDPAVHDVTYENSQARERTQILMDIANQTGGIVLGTGDLSELALGWATYNGDHMSMYGVNAGVPKTLVRYLVDAAARRLDAAGGAAAAATLRDIIDTPVSPELLPADPDGNIAQRTEDLVGPYELHDFFLYYMLRYGFSPRRIYRLAINAFAIAGSYSPEVILHWLRTFYRRFFAQQFKRSCLPDGPKVGSVCLSPRGDWRMPSDANAALWLRETESLTPPPTL